VGDLLKMFSDGSHSIPVRSSPGVEYHQHFLAKQRTQSIMGQTK